MKKTYTDPTLKVFVINADERVTSECGGGAHFTQIPWGCTELLVGGQGDAACNEGVTSGS